MRTSTPAMSKAAHSPLRLATLASRQSQHGQEHQRGGAACVQIRFGQRVPTPVAGQLGGESELGQAGVTVVGGKRPGGVHGWAQGGPEQGLATRGENCTGRRHLTTGKSGLD
jgi:hypothetical protein